MNANGKIEVSICYLIVVSYILIQFCNLRFKYQCLSIRLKICTWFFAKNVQLGVNLLLWKCISICWYLLIWTSFLFLIIFSYLYVAFVVLSVNSSFFDRCMNPFQMHICDNLSRVAPVDLLRQATRSCDCLWMAVQPFWSLASCWLALLPMLVTCQSVIGCAIYWACILAAECLSATLKLQ